MDVVTLSVIVGLALFAYACSGATIGTPITIGQPPVYLPPDAPPPPVVDVPPVVPVSGSDPIPPAPLPVVAQPPSQGGDMLDIHTFTIVGGSPDIRDWPITTQLAIVALEPAITPSFPDPGWPDVIPPGFDGPIQFTVWVFVPARGVGVGVIEMWRDRGNCGNNDAGTVELQLAQNWWYYVPELSGYVPAPGETIGFLVTPGDARQGKGPFPLAERSNLVAVTMP